MKTIRTAVVLWAVFGIFCFFRNANAEPFAGNKMFPDVSQAEKTVWSCDEGKTSAIMYRAIDQTEFRIFIVVYVQNFVFVMKNKSEIDTNWFAGFSLKAINGMEPDGWLSALQQLSPNFYRLLRHKSNDCAKE